MWWTICIVWSCASHVWACLVADFLFVEICVSYCNCMTIFANTWNVIKFHRNLVKSYDENRTNTMRTWQHIMDICWRSMRICIVWSFAGHVLDMRLRLAASRNRHVSMFYLDNHLLRQSVILLDKSTHEAALWTPWKSHPPPGEPEGGEYRQPGFP